MKWKSIKGIDKSIKNTKTISSIEVENLYTNFQEDFNLDLT